MRLTAAEKHEIIRLVEGSDLSVRRTLRELGVHRSTFYAWYRRYQTVGAAGLVPRPAAARRHWNRIPRRVRHRVVEAAAVVLEQQRSGGVWTIPAARMKAKRDHRVPLSGRALEILHDARRRSDGTGLVFRSPRGKPLSDMTLSKLIKELGIAAVPHGFRSSFRDWAAERTNTPREVVEAALAHTVRNPTEAAYARSDLFERRRRLMDDWATYLMGSRARGDMAPVSGRRPVGDAGAPVVDGTG